MSQQARPWLLLLLLCALTITILISPGVEARFMRVHPHDYRVIQTQLILNEPAYPAVVPTLSRAVNDVGPAVQNATELAYERARKFATAYANVIRTLMIPVGILITFVGYFLLTPVLFGAGLLTGGGAAFIALRALLGHAESSALWLTIVGSVLSGFVVGLIAVKLLSVGMFAIGVMMGVVIASALKPTLLAHIYPANHDVGFYVGAIILGIILGFVALRFQKSMLILATGYGGAFAFFFGIGNLAGHFPTSTTLIAAEKGHFGAWLIAYTSLTFIVGTAGAITQFRLSKGRPTPSRHAPRRRYRNANDEEEQAPLEDNHGSLSTGSDLYEDQKKVLEHDSTATKFDSVLASANGLFDGDKQILSSVVGNTNKDNNTHSPSPSPKYYGNVNVDLNDDVPLDGKSAARRLSHND